VVEGDTLVAALSTVDGKPSARILRHVAGADLAVPSDAGKPVYTWILGAADFATAAGQTLSIDDLARATARHQDQDAVGSCGRCLYAASRTPQLVNEGDSCPVPAFMKGATWKDSSGKRVATEAAEELEAARLSVRIDWPGECACHAPPPAPSLNDLDIRPIEPAVAPASMVAMAQGPSGRVAGVSRFGTFLHDPATGLTSEQPLVLDEDVRNVIALKNGSFVMVTETFSLGHNQTYPFHLMTSNGSALSDPVSMGTETAVEISHAEYLSDSTVYLGGSSLTGMGIQPAMAACDDRTMSCGVVTLGECRTPGNEWAIADMAILSNGIGVAHGGDMIYLKAANPPPMMNPLPGDLWTCQDRPTQIAWRDDSGEPVRVTPWRAMGEVEDRVFFCAETQPDPCGPFWAVVVTASVTTVNPEWRVTYRAPDWVGCRTFLKVPGQNIARLVLAGQRIVDFDASGAKIRDTTIASAYSGVPGLDHLQQEQPGWVLAWGSENQTYISNGGPFQTMYGGTELTSAVYGLITALPDGDFLAFGNPAGPARIHVTERPSFPVTSLAVVADPDHAFIPGDWIRAAVVDTFASTPTRARLMVAGRRENRPLMMAFEVEGGNIVAHEEIVLPEDLGERTIYGVAQLAAGRFLALVDDSILLDVNGTVVSDIEVDYDDPATPESEQMPTRGPNGCTHQATRVHVWRAVGGGQGVGWVAGSDGVVLRVVGKRAERFAVPGGAAANVTVVDARCADDVRFAGFGRLNPQDSERMQLFHLAPAPEDPRGIQIERLDNMELDQLTFAAVNFGRPRVLLPDAESYSIVLENGYVQRMHAPERPAYLRAPFAPYAVAQSNKGWVLFGADESRLALGVPR